MQSLICRRIEFSDGVFQPRRPRVLGTRDTHEHVRSRANFDPPHLAVLESQADQRADHRLDHPAADLKAGYAEYTPSP
ncbi:MAG: hypothetical protein KDA75_14410 [Planctomycetaceae bacterium]|nr:hypothetical protein [Planctomycetaceae bacterium]